MKLEPDVLVKKWHWEWTRDPANPKNRWIKIRVVDDAELIGVCYEE